MRRTAALVSIVLLGLLGACGGSDSASSDGGDTASAAPKALLDPCTLLSPKQIGPVLGGAVTVKEAPGGGCGFDQDDPRAASVGFFAVTGAGGGFEATKSGLTVDGKIKDVTGTADGAWYAVGKSGGDNVQGQGAVSVGGTVVNIAVSQADGLDAVKVEEIMNKLISLVGTIG